MKDLGQTVVGSLIIISLLLIIVTATLVIVESNNKNSCDAFGKIQFNGVVYSCIEEAS